MTTPWNTATPSAGSASAALALQASTGATGFALVNGTPSILSWTPPNDGNLHRVIIFAYLRIATLEVGGQIRVFFNDPSGGAANFTLYNGGAGVGTEAASTAALIVEAGSVVNLEQSSALASGAATMWGEIWGS